MQKLTEKQVYKVSELTRNIREILEGKFSDIWVEGEISNFVKHQSGHMYFSIRDNESVLSCVLFRGVNMSLKFEMKNGMHILCFGKISVYDKRGQYQLYIKKVEPKGAGALQIAFEQLKEKLIKEKLFDTEHKKPIPYLPQRIGVITSPTGAAIRDILNVTKRRFSNIEIIINPVRVQGEEAKHEIENALDIFNKLKNVDVIILGRGGGSLEDLWPFNEEIVARAIYRSKIPVISAVGHEVDWTISDFVSDFRAPTPSAAAELVIPQKEDLINIINSIVERLKNALISKVSIMEEKLNSLKDMYVLREPFNAILQYEQEVDSLLQDLDLKMKFSIKMKKENFNSIVGKLNVLSPLNSLKRGYSITSIESGKIIKDTKNIKTKDIITTRLSMGEIKSTVKSISK
jgi:exodeoxyribonuclease VII large subunit